MGRKAKIKTYELNNMQFFWLVMINYINFNPHERYEKQNTIWTLANSFGSNGWNVKTYRSFKDLF
jgi:hypothetical protein